MDIADFWTLDAECLRLTIDTFAGSALIVDDRVERAGAIEQHAHSSAFLPIGILDAALGFAELLMFTGLPGPRREKQRATKALRTIPIGVLKEEGGMHAQAC